MAIQVQMRRDTAANWTLANPLLSQGEFGLEIDTKKLKFGDGINNWNSLDYHVSGISNAENLGFGEDIYTTTSGSYLQFKTLVAAGNISLNSDASTVTISGAERCTLLGLTDTPTVYDNGKYLRSTASGTEWAEVSTGTIDHSLLSNLDFASSNHTGFASSTELATASGALNTAKADKSNVLELDNTAAFTPNANYEPATKKYVDDTFAAIAPAPGLTLSDDTSTDRSQYLPMTTAISGTWETGYTSSSKLYFNPSTGTLNSTVFNALSDESFKSNITTIDNVCEILNNIRGVEFNWKETGLKSSGVIAQELEKVLPHLVTTDKGIKSVNYDGITGYLIEAIKVLFTRVAELENKIKE